MMNKEKIIIIGTGPAGLTAAIYAARAGIKPTVFAGLQHGGQLTTTTDVENFPGFSEGILGPDLMKNMTDQATRVGANIDYSHVTRVDYNGSLFTVWVGEKKVEALSIILSTGATAKTLKLPHEDSLMGRGISTCATCDGFFYKNKTVVVVGGGDSAMEEALYLANLCKEVILVHRRSSFRASQIMLERAKNHPNITFKLPFTVTEPLFDASGLTGLVLENQENKNKENLNVDGLFYGIGHTPNSMLVKDLVNTDEQGYIQTENFTATKTPGLFAAGDVADHTFRQAITAAGMGCQAAMQATKYIESL